MFSKLVETVKIMHLNLFDCIEAKVDPWIPHFLAHSTLRYLSISLSQ